MRTRLAKSPDRISRARARHHGATAKVRTDCGLGHISHSLFDRLPIADELRSLGKLLAGHFPGHCETNEFGFPPRKSIPRPIECVTDGEPFVRLHIVLRHASTPIVCGTKRKLGAGVTLLCRLSVPRCRLNVIMDHAFASGVLTTEVVLGVGDALVSRLSIIFGGLNVIPGNALSDTVHESERGLGVSLPVFSRRRLEQSDSLDVIFGYAEAISIRISGICSGFGVTLVRRFLKPGRGLSFIMRHSSALSIDDAHAILGTGNALFSKGTQQL